MPTTVLPAVDRAVDRAVDAQVADLIVGYLEQLGIEYVFGVPGGAVEPLYNALARSSRRGGPRPVVARHESGAAFMAEGYARETGKIGVCCTTSGPGATNLITGVACAFDNAIPMLVITSQPALPSFGRRALQESACTGVDVIGMFRYCTRYNTLVSHVDQVESKVANALMRAHQAPPGPVHLSFPVDILRSPIGRGTPAYDLKSLTHDGSLIDDASVRALHAEIARARSMVIVVGGGRDCGEAVGSIIELAELTESCFVTSPDGKGLVNPLHRLYRGVSGFAGHGSAESVLREGPDVILAIGVALGELASGAWSGDVLNERLIHVDSSDEHLMRSPMARLHVRGRIRSVCERLVELLRADAGAVPARERKAALARPQDMLDEPDKFLSDAVPIKPQRLMRELSRRCPPEARFLADIGNSMAWAIHYLNPHDRRAASAGDVHGRRGDALPSEVAPDWLRVVVDFAPMGWAIGAAVGVALGNPERPVICITGDGSYLMSGQEITVAAMENLTVVFVILNDNALGMVKHGQRLAGAERIAFELPPVDFSLMAQSMGIPGHVVRSPAELDALDFEAILARKGPTLLDVRIDGEEVPPMLLRMKTLGTSK
jgi:acetolactate synthase-1/2/3 large subunit